MPIRLASPKTDLEAIAQVVNTFEETPVELDMVRRWFEYQPEGRITRRTVALAETGRVVGYGVTVREAWQPEGEFYAWVGVLPPYQGQGLGQELAHDARAFLEHHRVRRLWSEVRDDDLKAQAFAERAGFMQTSHLFASSVDVVRFDEAPYRHVLAQLEQAGLRFCSVAEYGDDAAARKRLYALNSALSRDIPGFAGPEAPYEDFEKWVCGSSWYRADGQLLAVDGDRWVGLCTIQLLPEAKKAYNVMTGVLPEYRGRKIALALKVLGIRYARENGASLLDTNNASTNAPMLAVNRKLGYVSRPGKYMLAKVVEVER